MSLRKLLSGEPTDILYSLKSGHGCSTPFNIAAGCPVHPVRPEQNIALLRRALEIEGHVFKDDYEVLLTAGTVFKEDFEKECRDYAKKFGMKSPDSLKFREKPKDLSRMQAKEKSPYESASGPQSHNDVLAVTFYPDDIKTIQRMANFFRPCNNSNTLSFKDKAACPDQQSLFPGITINQSIYKTIGGIRVPFNVEFIILKDGCQDDYKATHKLGDMERGFSSFWESDVSERKGLGDIAVVIAAGKKAQRIGQSRPIKNSDMLEKTGLKSLVEERQYFIVDGMPVMFARVGGDKETDHCIIPDIKTGFFRIENSYCGSLKEGISIPHKEFLEASMAIVPLPQIRQSPVLSLVRAPEYAAA